MREDIAVRRLESEAEEAVGGYYANYSPGDYWPDAVMFLRQNLGDEAFNRIMRTRSSFRMHPHVVARISLSREDWNRYVWIEQHGSLDGFAEQSPRNNPCE